MGSGMNMRCPKCGYEFASFEGVGYLFPKVYKETVQKAKSGELGDVLKTFFEEHPDGVINAENITLCCDKCGHLDTAKDLTMYVPRDDNTVNIEHGKWTVGIPFEGADYYTEYDLIEHFTEYMKYPHKCEKCGGDMRKLTSHDKLKCPDCKTTMEEQRMILWD